MRPSRNPAVVVVAVMALTAIVAAVSARPAGDRPLAARSGPSPGASTVVESDPRLTDRSPRSDPVADSRTNSANQEQVPVPQPDQPTLSSPFQELAARATMVFATDFATDPASLADQWEIYDSPGHAGLGLRRPSAITTATDPEAEGGSVLTITARMGTEGDEAGQLVSGGMALRVPRVYGTYTFRMRVDPDPAEVTSGVAILWPWSNRWPEDGELDMVETWANRATRTPVETNIHFLDPEASAPIDESDDRLLSVTHTGVDGTGWHTYRFEWRPEFLSMAIDDGPPRVLTDDPVHVPDWLMVPTFQLDAFPAPGGTRDDAVLDGPVTLEVDWLVIEE